MTKFLLTADWQIGLKANFAGEKADGLREVRFETARRIIELAQAETVDFIVLAGDTFDSEWLADDQVKRTLTILGAAKMPVYVLPGNHDPLRAGSLWESTAWQTRPENIHFLDQEKPVQAPGCTLYPCPLRQKQSGSNPTIWIPKRTEIDGIRIGVAHGALDNLGKPMNFPIPPNSAEVRELDFLGLGDWHGLTIDARLAYPGTPETCRFEESEPGYVLVVQIDKPLAVPQMKAHSVATLVWNKIEGFADSAEAVSDLLPLPTDDVSNHCYRIRIEAITAEARLALAREIQALSERAFWVNTPPIEVYVDEAIEIPAGLISQIDALLGENPSARAELRRILKEVSR